MDRSQDSAANQPNSASATAWGRLGSHVKRHLVLLSFLVSLLTHFGVMAADFSGKVEQSSKKPFAKKLQVVLVSGGNAKRPDYAKVVSQVDSSGGGNRNQEENMKSPLPPNVGLQGDVSVLKKRLRRIEAENKKIYSTLKSRQKAARAPQKGASSQSLPLSLPQQWAEIDEQYQRYQGRPIKRQITPRTRKAEYAIYYKKVQEKIEDVGTLHFPSYQGKKLYGTLVMYIPIFQDGSIYRKEGGLSIQRSSGIAQLDRAALRLVQMSAPFSKVPKRMRLAKSPKGGEVWEIITTFHFTKDGISTNITNSR